ncbi:site-specific integrase [Chitinophaga agrisoli]|uniref:Site-specific integrase n=1 Tax=Chitinophaga agrisoli TaxID=2607653 RepID=A0A5B2VJ68_9BACT|nr:site-specific integrase [Chitinophaga agrisoli]KAA2239121.1 site-specific integrase [Chitinophaga agrisoli]
MKVSQELAISFWLRKYDKNPGSLPAITARIIITGYPKVDISLGYQIDPQKFNRKAAEVTGKSLEAIEINKHILHVRGELIRYYNLLKAEGPTVTPRMIANAFQGIGKERKTLLQTIEFHNTKFKEKVDAGKKSEATLKKWYTTKDKLKAFLKAIFKLPDIPLEKIDYSCAEDFFDYLTLTEGITDNTASKYLKNTKQVLKLAAQRKWIAINPWHGYKCSYVDPERDILDMAELSTLYYKNITNPRLAEVRDAYVFMALTGYAYQDVLILEPEHLAKFFDGEDWIIKNREKTWCRENVPLLPLAKEILQKYRNHPYCIANNRLLPINSNQRFNSYLKEVADICSIKKNLTTHTARHTFATTVTLANGVPIETVSAMLGHKSIRTTQIYAKIVAAKVSKDMKALKENFKLSLPNSLFESAA